MNFKITEKSLKQTNRHLINNKNAHHDNRYKRDDEFYDDLREVIANNDWVRTVLCYYCTSTIECANELCSLFCSDCHQ